MPVYDLSALAEAFDTDAKQLDNILSRNEIAGVERRTRGVTRRVTLDAAVNIRVALDLAGDLGVPFARALRAAARLAADGGVVRVGEFASLHVDAGALRRSTLERLDSAVETVGKRPRGRPPKTVRSDG